MQEFFPTIDGWKPAVGFLLLSAAATAIISNTRGKAVLGSVWGAIDNAAASVSKPLPAAKKKA